MKNSQEEMIKRPLPENLYGMRTHAHPDGNYEVMVLNDERVKEFLINERNKAVAETLELAIDLITTHTEHDGSYCDTGEDMEWKCRSECVEMAVTRLKDRLTKEKTE